MASYGRQVEVRKGSTGQGAAGKAMNGLSRRIEVRQRRRGWDCRGGEWRGPVWRGRHGKGG